MAGTRQDLEAELDAEPGTEFDEKLEAELARPYPLTAEQIESFRRDGFILLPQVFTAGLLGRFGPLISRVVQAEDPNDRPLAERSAYGRAFTQITNLWARHAAVRRFSFNRRCARIATELLGCEGVRMWHDQALFKEAGGGITPWHVDQFFWPMSSDLSVTAWIPLQPTPVEAGALQFAAGTQHTDYGRRYGISERGESEIDAALSAVDAPVVAEPYALGDVSFHYGFTFHRAGPNRSTQTRAAMTMIYMDRDMRVAEPDSAFQEYDQKTWAPGCAVGDPIASPLNPVLYSKGD